MKRLCFLKWLDRSRLGPFEHFNKQKLSAFLLLMSHSIWYGPSITRSLWAAFLPTTAFDAFWKTKLIDATPWFRGLSRVYDSIRQSALIWLTMFQNAKNLVRYLNLIRSRLYRRLEIPRPPMLSNETKRLILPLQIGESLWNVEWKERKKEQLKYTSSRTRCCESSARRNVQTFQNDSKSLIVVELKLGKLNYHSNLINYCLSTRCIWMWQRLELPSPSKDNSSI